MWRLAALMSCATPVMAQDISLGLPIDCSLGETCYIQNYVDDDPGPATADFACGGLSYDGHDGTDFALPDRSAQAQGVAVLAAAAGQVTGIRDEMPDMLQGTPNAPDVTNRECGNGVVIRHTGGWETQYCHMARGSIGVQPGDQVAQGAVLGQVGLSGQTEFPHVHLTVRHNGLAVDPFDTDAGQTCGGPHPTLWATPVPYVAGGLLSAGFSSSVPDYGQIKAGTVGEVLTSVSPGLVVWGFAFGGQSGDEIRMTITGPTGEVIRHTDTLDRDQAQFFRAAGKRMPPGGWPAGTYTGVIELIRDDRLIDSLNIETALR